MAALNLSSAPKGLSSSFTARSGNGVSAAAAPGSSADQNALTELPPRKVDDLATQYIIDKLNRLTLGMGGSLARNLQQLASDLSRANGSTGASRTVTNGFQSGDSESLFALPVAKVDAPLDGAVYKQTDSIFASRPEESRVKAIYRVQLNLQIGVSTLGLLNLLPLSFPLNAFDIMVPAGFLYELEGENGLVYQMPGVPKVEAGLEIDPLKLEPGLGDVLHYLSPFVPKAEIKGETTIEWTFIWIHFPGRYAFRTLAVLMKVFNISPNQPFTIGLQSCEGNADDADLPVPFPKDSSSTDNVQPQDPPTVAPLR